MTCPCMKEGGKSRTWHKTRKLPMCAYVQAERRMERDARKAQRPNYNPVTPRNYTIPWVPGTSIFVEEFEEL